MAKAFLGWHPVDSLVDIPELPSGPFAIYVHLRNIPSASELLRYTVHFATPDESRPISLTLIPADSPSFMVLDRGRLSATAGETCQSASMQPSTLPR